MVLPTMGWVFLYQQSNPQRHTYNKPVFLGYSKLFQIDCQNLPVHCTTWKTLTFTCPGFLSWNGNNGLMPEAMIHCEETFVRCIHWPFQAGGHPGSDLEFKPQQAWPCVPAANPHFLLSFIGWSIVCSFVAHVGTLCVRCSPGSFISSKSMLPDHSHLITHQTPVTFHRKLTNSTAMCGAIHLPEAVMDLRLRRDPASHACYVPPMESD